MLKEQDELIGLILTATKAHGVAAGFAHVARLLSEHQLSAGPSELSRRCPGIASIFLPLDLELALADYDALARITARVHVPLSFAEARVILNLATCRALGRGVRLVCLDADDTIYSDGSVLTPGASIIPVLTRLLATGLHVGVVTAAAYPGEPSKYEARLSGLLAALAHAIECGAPPAILDRFHVVGGQCNYMLSARLAWVEGRGGGVQPAVGLVEVPAEAWKRHRGVRWEPMQVSRLLDTAQAALAETSAALGLDVLLIRKERAVGIVSRNASGPPISYEDLEECTLAVQAAVSAAGLDDIPHCAFNGGRDVFVDIGHKALGITALQRMLGVACADTVHCGDRFTATGNDRRAREVANTLWVTGPAETEALLERIIGHMHAAGRTRPDGQGAHISPLPLLAGGGSSDGGSLGTFGRDGAPVVGTPTLSPVISPTTLGISAHAALDLLPSSPPGDIAASMHAPSSPPHLDVGRPHFYVPADASVSAASPRVTGSLSSAVAASPWAADGGGAMPYTFCGLPHAASVAAQVRSQWAASGGVVVGEVAPSSMESARG
jgi:IMP and pyridine-specific 5'-nucleotidase